MSGRNSQQARVFGDPKPDAANSFQLDSKGLEPEEERELQTVPRPRLVEPRIQLADIVGAQTVEQIQKGRKITFHAVGDTGAGNAKVGPEPEISVADSMADDVAEVQPSPSFLFHLGDVVYYFGERSKYYEQFYSPFRIYDRPIFAIPGNHDGAVVSRQFKEESTEPSLAGFLANFCAKQPEPTPESQGIKREAMDQPGTYFTLDAPFVSIIGLYTNVLEGPGIISPRGLLDTGAIERVGSAQLEFLKSELTRLKPERERKERAVIVVCHHPPVTLDKIHGGGANLTSDLDEAYEDSGLVPDAVLSGHAHLYEHWQRTIKGRDIPYFVAGCGGINLSKPRPVAKHYEQNGFVLQQPPIVHYGYLLLTVDMTPVAPANPVLTIAFRQPAQPMRQPNGEVTYPPPTQVEATSIELV
jgi:3',5'-cyclic AMP phosphodiesterase CpdA